MKKMRYYLAAIALIATLNGSILWGIGSGSMANAASPRYASTHSSTLMAGKPTGAVAIKYGPPCPIIGNDC